MKTLLDKVVLQRAKWVLLIGLLFVGAASAFGSTVSDHLAPYDAQNPASESSRAEAEVQEIAGFNPNPGVTFLIDLVDGPTGTESQARIAEVVGALDEEPRIARVESVLDGDAASGLVATEGDRTVVIGNFAPATPKERQDTAEALLDRFDTTDWVIVGGIDAAQVQINKTSADDLVTAELIAFPVLFLLALWFFRGVVAALMPLLVAGVTILLTSFLLRVFAEFTTVSVFALNLVTALGLGLAIDYSLLFISRYREERARTAVTADALRRTLATAGRTVLFSALTVSGALSALLVFSENFLFSMGIAGIAIPLLCVFTTLVLLPAVLMLLDHRIDALSPAWLRRRADSEARPSQQGGWYRLSVAVMRRPARVAIAALGVLLILGLPALSTKFVLADERVLPDTVSARESADILREDFGPELSRAVFVVADAPAADAGGLTASLRELPAVAAASDPAPLAADTSIIEVHPAAEPLSDDAKQLVRDIRALESDTGFLVGGESARFLDQGDSLGERTLWAFLVVMAATMLFIFLVTGSVLLPVKSFVLNGLTLLASFGVLVFIFQDGRLEGVLNYQSVGALDSTQPILIMAIVLGLCTDYTVFLLARIKEAHDAGLSNHDAVASSVERTGRIITAAALMFCVAMVAFSTSDIVFLKQIGLGIAFAVLLDATLVRSTLVPALLGMFGKWNWWAPRPLRRLHARVGLSEGGAAPSGTTPTEPVETSGARPPRPEHPAGGGTPPP